MNTYLVPLFALAAATPALAQDSGFYASGGYTYLSAEDDGIDVDLGALGARAGYKFTPYLGLEGEALFGVADEDFTFEGVDVSAELNYAVGLYGRVEAPVTDRVTLYGRLGVVNAELEVTASVPGVSISESESETGAGFGAGAEFAVTDTFGIYADYTRYDIDELEIDGLSVGGKYRF